MLSVGAAKYWMLARPRVERLRLRHAPMLAAAAAFATGILLARRWQPPALLCSIVCLLFLLSALALRYAPRTAAIAVFAFWIGAGCWCAQLERQPDAQTELRTFADGLGRNVRGEVIAVRNVHPAADDDDPSATQQSWQIEPGGWEQSRGSVVQSVDIQIQAIEHVTPDIATMQSATGGVRLSVLTVPASLRCGDIIDVDVRLRVPDEYRDPGAFQSAHALLSQGIGVLGVVRGDTIQKTGFTHPRWRCLVASAQNWSAARMNAFAQSRANSLLPHTLRISATDAAMLQAMLFGDRHSLTANMREAFERTGTFHLFVVSGLHVSLLAGLLLWLLRRLQLRDIIAIPATLIVVAAYAVLTGFGEPVERALLMTSAYLLARLIARTSSALNALGIAAVVILACDPHALYDAGFQMTTLVIFGSAGLAAPLRERTWAPYERALRNLRHTDMDATMHPRHAAFRVHVRLWSTLLRDLFGSWPEPLPALLLRLAYRLADAFLLGLAIEACMVMPMAIYFHRATLLALPANILCIPLTAALLALSLVLFCAVLAGQWIALPFAALTAGTLHLARAIVSFVSHASAADMRLADRSALALLLCATLLLFACWAVREQKKPWLYAAACAIVIAPMLVLWPAAPLLHAGMLEVTALDVGQGDSVLVVAPNGQTLLTDAGGPVGGVKTASNFDVGEDVVAPYLWSRRITRLDAVMLTHAHSDHMGGMPAVLRDFRPRELWVGVEPAQSFSMRALLHEAAELGVQIKWFRAGDAFTWGAMQISVLAPEGTYTNPGAARNDDSLVMRVDYGKASALLEGDAEAPSEAAMLADGKLAPVTLLKVAHHGSKTSSGETFLQAVHPAEAVISVGRHNTFGHPRGDVLARLEAIGAKVFRTDHNGAETFLLNHDGAIAATSAATP